MRSSYANAMLSWTAGSPLYKSAWPAALLILGKHPEWFASEYKHAILKNKSSVGDVRRLHHVLLKGVELGDQCDKVLELLKGLDFTNGLSDDSSLPPFRVEYRPPENLIRFMSRRHAANQLVAKYETTKFYNLSLKGAKLIRGWDWDWDLPIFLRTWERNAPPDDELLFDILNNIDPCKKQILYLAIDRIRK